MAVRLNLEQLRKQAKERLAARRGAGENIKLSRVQHELAREHGYASWPKLVAALQRTPSLRYGPAPGEARTTIVVWEISDPSKHGDPRYWWSAGESAKMRMVADSGPDLTGQPKGLSLASLRARAVDDEVNGPPIPVSGEHDADRFRFSLAPWRDADPDQTYLIIAHQFAPKPEQRAALEQRYPGPPGEFRELRTKLRAAVEANDEARATELRRRWLQAGEKFSVNPRDAMAWDPQRAVEVEPGVFVQDERPRPA